jgi:hypothetical protein
MTVIYECGDSGLYCKCVMLINYTLNSIALVLARSINNDCKDIDIALILILYDVTLYEESVVDKFKWNLLLLIFWLNIINYNS